MTQPTHPTGPIVDTLSTNDLLGILYVLETTRKNISTRCDGPVWNEFLESFRPRLKNLSDEGRKELLIAHLLSVEDLDLFDDLALKAWLDTGGPEMARVSAALTDWVL